MKPTSEFKQRQKEIYAALREQSESSRRIARMAAEAQRQRYEQIWGKS